MIFCGVVAGDEGEGGGEVGVVVGSDGDGGGQMVEGLWSG